MAGVKPTVVFLHAFPFDPRMWGELPADAEAPLLYGPGETLEEWAAAILERYDGELVLVGASMGGYVAYQVARLAPERIRGLLTAGARAQADTPGGRARREQMIRVVREQGLDALWEQLRPQAFSRHAPAELLARARAWTRERDPDEVVRALAAMRDRRDTTDILKYLDPHPWIVLGELDELARPGDFENVVLPENVTVVRESGHLPSLERPGSFGPILEEFLRWTSTPTS
jgi:pimeloyl-ACP methyl ester carboxylesterase